jgi:hypothetical protein
MRKPRDGREESDFNGRLAGMRTRLEKNSLTTTDPNILAQALCVGFELC